MSNSQPEVWMRGAVPGFEPLLQPAVHAFLQAKQDIEALVSRVPDEHTWSQPGGAASIGFHIRHIGGATDRLLTYARGGSLTPDQIAALKAEGVAGASLAEVAVTTQSALDRALEQLRTTERETLLDDRKLGRAALPTTVIGLLFHAAEHATRHIGQAITTAKILASHS